MIVNDSNPKLQRWESPRAGRKHAPGIQCMVLYPQAGVLQFAGGRGFPHFPSVFSAREEPPRIAVATRRMLRNRQPKGSKWASAASFPQDDRSLAAGGNRMPSSAGLVARCSVRRHNAVPLESSLLREKGPCGLGYDFRKQTWRGSADGPNDGSSIHCDEIGR
jgi:hypothetical protein